MIIDNLNVLCTAIRPYKAQAELIVDANAVLAGTVSRQRLKPISRRRAEVIKTNRGIQIA
jgi:hypothetical protein